VLFDFQNFSTAGREICCLDRVKVSGL